MDIKETKKNGVNILSAEQKLDINSSPDLEKKIISLSDSGEKNFILDLTNLNYISSSGLRVILLGVKKASASGGKFVLAGIQDHVKSVFDIAGFTSMLSIYPTVDDALKSFQA